MNVPGMGGDETKPKSYYQRRGIVLVIFLVVFAGLKWGLGWLQGPSWNYLAIFISGMIIVTDSMANEARYTTREKIVTDNRTFSFNPRSVFEVGDWLIIEVGGMNVSFWPAVSGGEGTVVFPKELAKKQHENIRVYGRPHQVKFEELPSEVRKVVKDQKLGEPYRFIIDVTYLSVNNEEAKEKVEALAGAEDILEDRQRRISELEELNQKKFKDLESAAETGKSIAGPSKFERWKKKFTGRGGEGEE